MSRNRNIIAICTGLISGIAAKKTFQYFSDRNKTRSVDLSQRIPSLDGFITGVSITSNCDTTKTTGPEIKNQTMNNCSECEYDSREKLIRNKVRAAMLEKCDNFEELAKNTILGPTATMEDIYATVKTRTNVETKCSLCGKDKGTSQVTCDICWPLFREARTYHILSKDRICKQCNSPYHAWVEVHGKARCNSCETKWKKAVFD